MESSVIVLLLPFLCVLKTLGSLMHAALLSKYLQSVSQKMGHAPTKIPFLFNTIQNGSNKSNHGKCHWKIFKAKFDKFNMLEDLSSFEINIAHLSDACRQKIVTASFYGTKNGLSTFYSNVINLKFFHVYTKIFVL